MKKRRKNNIKTKMKFRTVFVASINFILPVYSLSVHGGLKIDTMGSFGHFIPRCDILVPESTTSATTCWSSCGSSSLEARCNGQGENWQRSFALLERPLKQTPKGSSNCSQHERRFLCTLLSAKNKECASDLLKKLKPGDLCYTKCGSPNCPEGDFEEPRPQEDFKYMDCEGGGFRIRCVVRKHEEKIEYNLAALPLVLPVE